MTPVIDFGGHPMKIVEDKFADGRKCVVAEHTDLPGCIVYADTLPAALAALREARAAYDESVKRHDRPASNSSRGAPCSAGAKAADENATAISGAGSIASLLQPA